jgi:hypothetical protein
VDAAGGDVVDAHVWDRHEGAERPGDGLHNCCRLRPRLRLLHCKTVRGGTVSKAAAALGIGLFVGTLIGLYLASKATGRDRDWGGWVHEYAAAGDTIKASGVMWEIPRVCFSACTVKADRARPYACLGPKSQMGFHQQYDPTDGFTRPPYSADLDYALPNPLPRKSGWWMPREVALKFWKEC